MQPTTLYPPFRFHLGTHLQRARAQLLMAVLAAAPAIAGEVNSFDDILFWVGEGSQQSALVVDWDGHDAGDFSLTWGFRWDGVATSADMFDAIVASDSRLFAKTGAFGNGVAVYGIGYDANADSQFGLNDGSEFDLSGRVLSGPADLAVATDVDDWYAEGWLLGYWYHAIIDDSAEALTPNAWSRGLGLSSRTLSDGDWDSLAYKDTTDFTLAAASRPMAAEEFVPGDFNNDSIVSASDFTVWRDRLGDSVLIHGYGADGDRDGQIDMDDYEVWKSAFVDANSLGVLSTPANVPEPRFNLFAAVLFAWTMTVALRLKENRYQ